MAIFNFKLSIQFQFFPLSQENVHLWLFKVNWSLRVERVYKFQFFLSSSSWDVEGEAISKFTPLRSPISKDGDPCNQGRPPNEASNARQDDHGLHGLLLREWLSTKCLLEEPDGVDEPEERQKRKSSEEISSA